MTAGRIVYVGCGLAGKRTSLTSVRAQGASLSLSSLGNEEHAIAWPSGSSEKTRHLLLSASIMRAWLRFDTAEEAMSHTIVADEMTRLRDVLGLVFVLDSQQSRFAANVEHFSRLSRDLSHIGIDINSKPIVFQVNKRDLLPVCSMATVQSHFSASRCAFVESIATQSIGTLEALQALVALVDACDAET